MPKFHTLCPLCAREAFLDFTWDEALHWMIKIPGATKRYSLVCDTCHGYWLKGKAVQTKQVEPS